MTDRTKQAVYAEWKLILENKDGDEEVFLVDNETVTVGRDLDNDIPLDDLYVSKHHLRLTQRGDQLIIEDLHSINGTIVNAGPLTGPYTLRHNDTIKLGSFTFHVKKTMGRLPQSRIKTSVHTVPSKAIPWLEEPAPNRAGLLVAALAILVLILLAGLFLWGWAGQNTLQTTVEPPSGAAGGLDLPEITVNQAPTDNSRLSINEEIVVEATASDRTGMQRLELWVDGRKVDEAINRSNRQVTSMTAALAWRPDTPGAHTLELRAYNASGLIGRRTVAALMVAGQTDTPTPEPTATVRATPSPRPTATPSHTPSPTSTFRGATLVVDAPILTVRSGPSAEYSQAARLVQGDRAEILGQATSDGDQWWQIRYTEDGSRYLGWVTADPAFSTVVDAAAVPTVEIPASPTPTSTMTPTPTTSPTPSATPTPNVEFIYAPEGKTLLIVSNRSLANQPSLLTLSGGQSVGGGRQIDVPAGQEVQIVLEPDTYQAMWSSTGRAGSFAQGMDFDAIAGKVMVMWIVPEERRTETELYDQLMISPAPEPVVTALPSATPDPIIMGYTAPLGKALIVAANRSLANANAHLTISGGSFGGGQEFTLDANTEMSFELLPGHYRTVWNIPIRSGGFIGHEFDVSGGEVILFWVVPEDGTLFKQRPDQPPEQINN